MSSNAMAIVGASRVAQQPDYDSADVIATIKQTVAKGATDAQLSMFLHVAKSTGLNPFLKEIWYVPDKGIIMAGRDGYLRVANEHPMFDGMETRVERGENNLPIKAVCTVWRKDRSHPTVSEAYFNEYNKGSGAWSTYKSAMIGKVAEVLALKRSFSINGVVTEEEIGPQEFIEPAGSVEAAQAVAQRKIAEAKKKATPIDTALPALEAGANAYDAAIERAKVLMKAYVGDSTDMNVLAEVYPKFWGMDKWSKVAKLNPALIEEGNDKLQAYLDEQRSLMPVWETQYAMLADFKFEKERIGDADYYAILEKHGVKKSNEFKAPTDGIKCFMELRRHQVVL